MKNAMMNFKSWLMLITMMVVSSAAAFSAVPSAPQDLEVPKEGKDFPFGVILKWEMPDNSPAYDGFNFYLADGFTSQMSDFSLTDSLELMQDSIPMGQMGEFYHFIQGLEKGKYTVYATAKNADGESVASNLVEFQVKSNQWEDRIYFTSEMPTDWTINKNVAWTYDADAESESDLTIKYKLDNEPTGMTIDATTGVVSWTPTESGAFEFTIVAYEEDNEDNEAFLWMPLYVTSCEIAPVVSGTVKNKAGELIERGEVTIIDFDNSDSLGTPQKYFHGTIENGLFSLEADEGEYILIVHAPGYRTFPESYEDATPFTLACAAQVQFDITLDKHNWNKERINFTTFPTDDDLHIALNENWTFDFDAEADVDDLQLVFSLKDEPQGMTIDASTGVVSWTPTESGRFFFSVMAEDENNNAKAAILMFELYVSTCSSPIIVSGTVNYDPENPGDELEPVEDGAFAVLFSISQSDSLGNHYPQKEFSAPIIDGQYTLEADAGTYYLWFGGRGEFVDEFWENALHIDEATQVTLECGNDYTFNALVEAWQMPDYYTVSGKVTDEATGEGIPYAFVQVIGTNNQNYHMHSVVVTDEDGEYEVELNDQFDYVFRASTDAFRPCPGKDSINTDIYIPEYYDNVTDITAATVITLTEDVENIDFALTKAADYDNTLSGTVFNNDGTAGVKGWVVAFLVETDANNQDHINWGFTAVTTDTGEFSFEGLIPGDYILLAFPEDFDFAPGYYVQGDLASLNWAEATRITVAATGDYNSNNIKLQKMEDVIGSGIIAGKISKRGKNGGMMEGQGDPITGALVYAVNEDGNIVEFKRTGNMGDFRVDNLANGRYNIVVDKVGFNQLSMYAEITDDRKEITMETMTLNETTTSVEDKVFAEVSLYPNPAVSHITVNLGTLPKDANISLVDATGVTLYNGTVKSNENHKIDVDGIASGMYYLKVKIDEEVTVLPVSIAK